MEKLDTRTHQTQSIDPTLAYPGNDRRTWTLPLVFSPRDPRVLYFSNQRMFRTEDGGQHWTVISPDLTRENPRRSGESRSDHRRGQSAARPAAGRDLRDRAVAHDRSRHLGRHRRRPDLAHARRRRALAERDAGRADAVVEGRHHRRLAFRRRDRVRGDRSSSHRRFRRRTSTARTTAASRGSSHRTASTRR